MPEGYCVKCKANGRKAIKGKCPTCGVVMFKILGGKASPAEAKEGKESKAAAVPSAGAGTEKATTSVG
jgi:hypothetical protein